MLFVYIMLYSRIELCFMSISNKALQMYSFPTALSELLLSCHLKSICLIGILRHSLLRMLGICGFIIVNLDELEDELYKDTKIPNG